MLGLLKTDGNSQEEQMNGLGCYAVAGHHISVFISVACDRN